MRRTTFPLLLILMLPLAAPRPGAAQVAPDARRTITRHITRGIDLVQEIIPEGDPQGPLIVTTLRINPRTKGVRIEAALGQDQVWGDDPTKGREIVSTLAARHHAAAAINAGFFPYLGNPIGLHIQNGDLVTEPQDRRSVFGLTRSGRAVFGRYTYQGTVRVGNTSHSITALNRAPGKSSEILLYTPIFFSTTLPAPDRFEVSLGGISTPLVVGREYTGKVLAVRTGGEMPLSRNTIVLSGGGDGADWLRGVGLRGAKLSFRIKAIGESVNPALLQEAIAGGPRLLTNGRVTIDSADEGFKADFSTTRHPRTAIGETRDGLLLFMVVDGRQKGLSRGASLTELANLLLKAGAVNAVNMDGGGSSDMVVRDLVVNSPSDGVERAVANMWLVFGEPFGNEARRKSNFGFFASKIVRVGDNVNLAPPDADPYGIWGTNGGIGFVTQDGVFHAVHPGTAKIHFSGGGYHSTADIQVIGADTKMAPEDR